LFGNIGEYPKYKPCEIYSVSSNFKKIERQEAIAMNISTMVYEQGLQDVGKEELKEAENMYNSEYIEEMGNTFAELQKILLEKYSKTITKRSIHTNSSGILVSTTYGQPPPPVHKDPEESKKYDHLVPITLSQFKIKSRGAFLSNTRDWVVVPVYTKLIPGTEKWYCRFKR
jgi:hypothetical protein